METFLNNALGFLGTLLVLLLVISAVIFAVFLAAGLASELSDNIKKNKIEQEKIQYAKWKTETVPILVCCSDKSYTEYNEQYVCSECGEWQKMKTKYCSNCGREMKDE